MTQPSRPQDSRAALASFVTNRLGRANAARPEPATETRKPVQSENQSFEKLTGYRELRLQRSAADLIGLNNPFFRVHESRAAATTRIEGKTFANYSSYDYLGLNGHPAVSGAARKAIETYGTSASASRLVAGERPVHLKLEQALASHYETEACVVMVSGHATNVTTIGAILEPADVIFHDALIHNSVVTGAQLSGAQRRSFAHNDPAALEKLLEATRHEHRRALIVIEGLYSMDGDAPDLAAFVELKRRYDCWLMVDDAHGLGVLGRTGAGLHEHCGVDAADIDIWMGTLSKTLSSCGGYVCGPAVLVEYLKCTAGGFLYSVGMSPPLAAAAEAALSALACRAGAGRASSPQRQPLPGGGQEARTQHRYEPGARRNSGDRRGFAESRDVVRPPVQARHQRAADHPPGGAGAILAPALLHDLGAYTRADRRDRRRGRR